MSNRYDKFKKYFAFIDKHCIGDFNQVTVQKLISHFPEVYREFAWEILIAYTMYNRSKQ
jgi:hypothetical protein